MSKFQILLTLPILFFVIPTSAQAQTRSSITLCYNPGPYAPNGAYMTFVANKLQNPDNFGPNGRVKTTIKVTELAPPITLSGLATVGCDVFQIGLDEGDAGTGDHFALLSLSDVQALRTWSNLDKSKIVFGSQGYVTQWGQYVSRPGAQNPMNSTAIGEAIAFNGPFGRVITGFNQGGSWQGVIVPGASDRFCTIVEDSSTPHQPVVIIDRPSGDFLVSDVDIFSQLGGVTASPQITSNNDIILANLWALFIKIVEDGPADVCSSLPIPDLTPTTLTADRTLWPSSVQLSIRVTNVGGGTTLRPSDGGLVGAAFYLGDPAAGGTLIGKTQTSRSLAPAESEDVSVTWTNPPIGLHSIFAVVDPSNLVAESDETNNETAALVPVGVGPFPLVDDLLTRQKDRGVDLTWSAIPGAVSYNVYRRLGSASTKVAANSINRSFSDTNLTNGSVYYYLVRWVNAQGVESADGTESSATPTPTGATGANPPTITSRPNTLVVVGQPYTYAFRTADPDAGAILAYSLVAAPAGMTISSTGAIAWTPTTAQAGYTRVRVQVTDNTGRFATQSFSLFADIQRIINSPPVITSTPIRSATSGSLYAYQVVGNDPDGSFLTWSLDVAPLGMSINQATGLIQWIPARDQVGTQNATARVTDIGGLSATQTFNITITRGNRTPTFTSYALTISRVGEQYQYPVAANDPDGDPLMFTLVGGPAGMTMAANTGLVTWTPPATAANTSVLVTLRVADDGGLTATQGYTLLVLPPNQRPVITSFPVTQAAVGSNYTYQVTATDPDLPNDGLTFSLAVFPIGMTISASSGLVQWTPSASLINTTQNVTLQAKDLAGAIATQSFQIRVGPADTTQPTVSIATPANGDQLTNDTLITGTATDANLKNWILEYQVSGASTWTTLSTGTTPVSNGPLGSLPATLLANNPYRLRLTAFDSAQSNSATIEVNVNTGQLKLGDFTLNFEDIRVPGFTFPISILRKYDSKRSSPGDFGPGWMLGFSEVDVRTNANNDVFMTLPDGRRVTFTSTPTPAGLGVFNTDYTAQNGIVDTLQNLDCPQVFGSPGNFLCNGFQAWNPQNYLLTTKEGLKYTINAQSGISQLEDRSGNFIQIAITGVTSNFGRNVTFQRDGSGRITTITEPGGGQTKYSYDGTGRLAIFTDQAGNATTFFYENSQFPNYLTKIVDPLGRPVTRSVYDATGRLIGQCDASGNVTTLAGCMQFNSQPATRILTTLNGRGFKTDLFLDSQGNVLTERHWLDSSNFLDTVRTYDANNNTLTERDPAGNTKTYTYDVRNNKLSETDQGGHKTTYTYSSCDKVATQTDPAANVTKYSYDATCNLRFVTDALNNTTEYRYNIAGQRTQFIDPLGL